MWPGGMRLPFTEWAEGERVLTGCWPSKRHFLKVPSIEQRCRVNPVLQPFISCPHFRKWCLACLHLLAKSPAFSVQEMAQSSNASGSPWSSWRCSCKLLVSVSFKAGRILVMRWSLNWMWATVYCRSLQGSLGSPGKRYARSLPP